MAVVTNGAVLSKPHWGPLALHWPSTGPPLAWRQSAKFHLMRWDFSLSSFSFGVSEAPDLDPLTNIVPNFTLIFLSHFYHDVQYTWKLWPHSLNWNVCFNFLSITLQWADDIGFKSKVLTCLYFQGYNIWQKLSITMYILYRPYIQCVIYPHSILTRTHTQNEQ